MRPIDRLIAHFLADRIGATFEGQISGVTKAGLFIKLDETGADGFVPAATIGADYYRYDERTHSMRGERTGETYRLGDQVEVKLVEAAPVAGALRFELLTEGPFHRQDGAAARKGAKRPPRGARAGKASARAQRLPDAREDQAARARLTFEGSTMSLTIETARPAHSDEVKAIPAMKRGFLGRCPACGEGRLFGRFLKVVDHCEACGTEFHHHRADDLPPYIVIFIVGHLVGYGILMTETSSRCRSGCISPSGRR